MEKEKLTEARIQKHLDEHLFNQNSIKYKAENLFVYTWERKDKQLKELKEEMEYYKDSLSESGIDNSISLYIIRRMRQALADNNVNFDFSKLENEAIELYKKEK